MRIQIIGESAPARTLRGYLTSLGYTIASTGAAYTVVLEEGTQANVLMEGVRGPLAEEAQHAVAELTQSPVEWRKAAQGSERQVRVTSNGGDNDAVERGILRALLRLTQHGGPTGGGLNGWVNRILGK